MVEFLARGERYSTQVRGDWLRKVKPKERKEDITLIPFIWRMNSTPLYLLCKIEKPKSSLKHHWSFNRVNSIQEEIKEENFNFFPCIWSLTEQQAKSLLTVLMKHENFWHFEFIFLWCCRFYGINIYNLVQ